MPARVPTLGGAQLWQDRRWRDGWRVQRHVWTGHHRVLDPGERRVRSGDLASCLAALPDAPCPETLVVVLHGLGRTRRSMRHVEETLGVAGFAVARLDYASTRRPIPEHAAQVLEVLGDLPGTRRVHFVTHSLGGIVARLVLASEAWPAAIEAGRLVMFAPPNRGASLAQELARRMPGPFRALMGPSSSEIAAGLSDVPPPRIPFAVVAGNKGDLNPLIPGDDDGIVGVQETKLEGMAVHREVEALHTFVMDHPEAQATMVEFLRGGD